MESTGAPRSVYFSFFDGPGIYFHYLAYFFKILYTNFAKYAFSF